VSPEKQRLMRKLALLGLGPERPGYVEPLPLVSLEDFFEGNEDPESIAVNLLSSDPRLSAHPGLRYFYDLLKGIRSLPNVQDVLVEVFEIETALADEASWPFAEKVFFLTSAPRDEIERWSSSLKTDGPIRGFPQASKGNAPALKPGYDVWHVVWD
jgi:hypothetical protein